MKKCLTYVLTRFIIFTESEKNMEDINFKQLRKRQNVKQLNVKHCLLVSSACISQWESGKRQPSIEQLPKIAEVLNCSIEEVVLALIETKNQSREVM